MLRPLSQSGHSCCCLLAVCDLEANVMGCLLLSAKMWDITALMPYAEASGAIFIGRGGHGELGLAKTAMALSLP